MSEIFSNADILMLPSFISTTSDKTDTVPVEDGQIIVLSDKSGYFYDFDGKRRAVGGISFIPDLSESGQEDILYICTEPAGLYQSVIFCGQFNTCPSVPLPTPAFALV